MPADKPFYPTDHCGVLRIKTDDILPKYMALALQVEGEFERFSRSNRASTQRIANLIIQVPSVPEQQKIVDEIEAIDKGIADEQATISEQSAKVKSKFVEMFGDLSQYKVAPFESTTIYFEDGDWIETKDQSDKGIRLLQVGNIGNGFYVDKLKSAKYISLETFDRLHCKEVLTGDILISRLPSPVGRACIIPSVAYRMITAVDCTIVRFNTKILNKYFFLELTQTDYWDYQMKQIITGIFRDRISRSNLGGIPTPLPNIELQQSFADFVRACDKLKFEAQERLDELNAAREDIIAKYFR